MHKEMKKNRLISKPVIARLRFASTLGCKRNRLAEAAWKEKKIRDLEQRFIDHSGEAFATAQRQSQAAGHCLLISDHGVIFEVDPSGKRKPLKTIEPPTPVTPGLKVILR